MVQINDRGVNVAVLGATGQVGMVMRRVLDERDFPVKDLRFLASAHSAGKVLNWRGHDITVEDVATADLSGIDIAIFSAGGGTSGVGAEVRRSGRLRDRQLLAVAHARRRAAGRG